MQKKTTDDDLILNEEDLIESDSGEDTNAFPEAPLDDNDSSPIPSDDDGAEEMF
jgi:hypothetical protein